MNPDRKENTKLIIYQYFSSTLGRRNSFESDMKRQALKDIQTALNVLKYIVSKFRNSTFKK